MADRWDEFRQAASDCLQLARLTSDPQTRASLLLMAQKWFDLANESGRQAGFDAALQVFNDGQMRQKPAMQQQQQVQLKKDKEQE